MRYSIITLVITIAFLLTSVCLLISQPNAIATPINTFFNGHIRLEGLLITLTSAIFLIVTLFGVNNVLKFLDERSLKEIKSS